MKIDRLWTLGVIGVALAMAGCAAGPNPLVGQSAGSLAPAGFWLGVWHGAISPITFFVSLFANGVGVYEVHNAGHWYDFGFGLGVLCALSGSGGTAARRRWRTASRGEA